MLPVTTSPVTSRAVDLRGERAVRQLDRLVGLLQDPLVADLGLELSGVELLEFGLLEVAAGDAAVELHTGHRAVGTHDPGGARTVEAAVYMPAGADTGAAVKS